MEYYTGNDTTRAKEEPTEEHTYNKGMGHLHRIAMPNRNAQRRHEDSPPAVLGHLGKPAGNGSAEHNFFCQRSKDGDGKIAARGMNHL